MAPRECVALPIAEVVQDYGTFYQASELDDIEDTLEVDHEQRMTNCIEFFGVLLMVIACYCLSYITVTVPIVNSCFNQTHDNDLCISSVIPTTIISGLFFNCIFFACIFTVCSNKFY